MRMKKIISAIFAVLLFAIPATAQDFDKGLDAFWQGDFATALKELKPLAEQGNVEAQYNLGVLYENGRGVVLDNFEAAKWYRKAAEQGIAKAQYKLGVLHQIGRGVLQDYVEAAKWYRKSAVQGNAGAQSGLGGLYWTGRGVKQDIVVSHVWFNIAARNGDEYARRGRDRATDKLSPSDRNKAQALARKCLESNYQVCP